DHGVYATKSRIGLQCPPQSRNAVRLEKDVVIKKTNHRMLTRAHAFISLACCTGHVRQYPYNVAPQLRDGLLAAQLACSRIIRGVDDQDLHRLCGLSG